jgi:hypothetical protein
MWQVKTLFLNVLIGLLLAGPLAALALVALPEAWRGPAVPWTVAAIAVAVVTIVRRPQPPAD